MDAQITEEPSLHIDHTTTNMDNTNAPPTFASTWQPTDASSLAPTNLPVAKAQRAWDRRPQSPFSRAKVRFGKVWKRNSNTNHATPSIFGNLQNFEFAGVESPVKAVKKMRMAGGEQLVSNWEGRGSPKNRRIVTRANREGEDLVALVEDEDIAAPYQVIEEEENVLKVEVVNEDGTIEEIEGEEELSQEEWEDESMTEEDPNGWDATLMHLAELREQQDVEGVTLDAEEGDRATPCVDANGIDEKAVKEAHAPSVASVSAAAESKDDVEHIMNQEATTIEEAAGAQSTTPQLEENSTYPLLRQPPVLQAAQLGPIPEGFVSPVKEKRRRPIREVKQANANRRRTLPVNFATQLADSLAATTNVATEGMASTQAQSQETDSVSQVEDHPENVEEAADATMTENLQGMEQNSIQDTTESDKDQWEDVEHSSDSDSPRQYNMTPEPMSAAEEWIPTVENTPESSPELPMLQINPDITRLAEEQMAAGKLASSPVGSITGQHPRLPLRRSPRRKSSSPLKRSILKASGDKSHLVAFTPIKMLSSGLRSKSGISQSPNLPSSPDLLQKTDVEDSTLTRSSSAPLEEPQMSPRKPPQPRMSDDTATLKAFLDRAAESKNGRRTSETAKRESLENRRNSDTVRQALASPVVPPVEVLADLDPNSPSPRKQANQAQTLTFITETPGQEDEDELAIASPARKSRRSGRTKRKDETLEAKTYSGPTKISVRGAADGVVLKKTEAQELAQATRNNTRKNKGTAVLPRLRLTRMANEDKSKAGEGDGSTMEVEKPTKIQWAETLASFYAGENEPEISMMTDDGPEPDSAGADEDIAQLDLDGQAQASMPPPSETPSKPKIRRLKPRGTPRSLTQSIAQEDTKPEATEEADAKAEQPAVETKPKQKKRQSRIATPAKPPKDLGGLSFLPDDVATKAEDSAATKPSSAPAPAKKKAIVSKLPAPASSVAAGGKENSLIASPPKKRTRAAPSLKQTKLAPTKLDLSALAAPTIASPAKKSVKTQVLGPGEDSGLKAPPTRQEVPPSLGSPAKKRTRRAVG